MFEEQRPRPRSRLQLQSPSLLVALEQQLSEIANDPRLTRATQGEMNAVTRQLLPQLAPLTEAIHQIAAKVDEIAEA